MIRVYNVEYKNLINSFIDKRKKRKKKERGRKRGRGRKGREGKRKGNWEGKLIFDMFDNVNSGYWDCISISSCLSLLIFLYNNICLKSKKLHLWKNDLEMSTVPKIILYKKIRNAHSPQGDRSWSIFAREPRFRFTYLFKTIVIDLFTYFWKKWLENKSEFYFFTILILLIPLDISFLYIRCELTTQIFLSYKKNIPLFFRNIELFMAARNPGIKYRWNASIKVMLVFLLLV